MKQFKGVKQLDDFISNAKKLGWEVDLAKFDTGSDYIFLRDMHGSVTMDGIPRQIAVNVTNGFFFVYEPFSEEPVATHISDNLDNEDWYVEILELIYEPLEV